MYPEPGGKTYDESELKNPHKVVELFDYCQILLAYITKSGWDFLINHYGYKELFKLNKKSEWLDCNTIEEYVDCIKYEYSISK